MHFWLLDGEGCGVADYQNAMAQYCAAQIRDWLSAGARGDALLWKGDKPAPVKASDITVLVRSRQEAALIRDALTLLNIPSVYLSNRDSVFETLEAQEMLWLLQAVLAPERESALRSALASAMLGLNARDIDVLNNDEAAWDAVVEEFVRYREKWQKRGVMAMVRELMAERHIAENMLATAGGERRLTDILHISELLQEAGTQLESEHAWCAGWRSRLPTRTVIRPASRCALRVINTWCKSSPFTNRKAWNIRWSGCHLLPISASRIRRFITIATRLRPFWILMLRQKASTSRRPNVWRKICVYFTWR